MEGQVVDTKKLAADIVACIRENFPKNDKRIDNEEKNRKHAKPDVPELLRNLRECVIEDPIERLARRLTPRSPAYFDLMARVHLMNTLSSEDFGDKMAFSTAVLKRTKALHTLLIVTGMHKLRKLCPTPEILLRLIVSYKYVQVYMDGNPQELEWWREPDTQLNSATWIMCV